MNANELADELNRLQKIYCLTIPFVLNDSATMLRQQQAEIINLMELVDVQKAVSRDVDIDFLNLTISQQQAEIDTYKSQNGSQIDTYRYKELTDEEINVVAILQDAEIVPVGHEIWKTSEEFNKYKRIVLATAKALRKAQE